MSLASTKYLLKGVAALFGLMLAPAVVCAGPISPFYVTAGDEGHLFIIQGSTATLINEFHPGNGGEYAIAVSDTVRTLGNGNAGRMGPGSQYTLAGAATGLSYAYPPINASFYSGTSDGTSNYAVDYFNGGVYRFNADWSHPVELFGTPAFDLGIAYDPSNHSLWVAQHQGPTITDYSLSGTVLGSFNTIANAPTCLALDPADGTLWLGDQSREGTFYQYSRSGALLSTSVYANLIGQNTLGGAFSITPVPEPSTMALLVIGVIGVVKLRRQPRHK